MKAMQLPITLVLAMLLSSCAEHLTGPQVTPGSQPRAYTGAAVLPVADGVEKGSNGSTWGIRYSDETCGSVTYSFAMDILPEYRTFYLYGEDEGNVVVDISFVSDTSGTFTVPKFPPPYYNRVNLRLWWPIGNPAERYYKEIVVDTWHFDLAASAC